MNAIKADDVEGYIYKNNWGIKDCLNKYNVSEEEFLKIFRKQYKFTAARCEDLIAKMRLNDENKAKNAEVEPEIVNETVEDSNDKADLENVEVNVSKESADELIEISNTIEKDEIDSLSVEAENCSKKLVELKEKFKKLEAENLKHCDKIMKVRKNIEKILESLNDKEAEAYKVSNAIGENLKNMEACSEEITECAKRIAELKNEIEAKKVIKIFCGNCNNAEDYTEVWSNGVLPEDEIRSCVSRFSICPEMDKFEDLSVKQLRNAVEFYMLAKFFEKSNDKKVEYTFESDSIKSVFETVRLINIE